MGRIGLQGLGMGDALHPGQFIGQQLVGLGFDPLGDVGVGRAAIRRVVLVAAALRWVMGRRDHDAVGQAAGAATVVANNGVGNRRCRGVLVALGQHHVHAIGRQHFQGAGAGRRRQRVSVQADKQRAVDALGFTVKANGLADGKHVPFIEAQVERAAAVPGGTKGDTLGGDRCIRLAGVIGRYQSRDVYQQLSWCRLARKRTESHA